VTYDLANPIFMTWLIDRYLFVKSWWYSFSNTKNVTTRTAFNVIPFENSVVVIGLGLKSEN
jgi:hypothetical protein